MVFVMESASHLAYRDETTIFVIDVHSFYDEKVTVIEVVSFYDDLFSSLKEHLFCHNLPSVRRSGGVCHAGC